ncbi:hypothetical protein TM49_12185 [Martelella endophytica]|uniref:Uncharacterized protein n=1 Tax=Martelella endophytica TaxID=1486262 RepID=A0A0D5LPV0_MAREN|nr:hypothetical protein TM49_12185 [Martelella endophytica]
MADSDEPAPAHAVPGLSAQQNNKKKTMLPHIADTGHKRSVIANRLYEGERPLYALKQADLSARCF